MKKKDRKQNFKRPVFYGAEAEIFGCTVLLNGQEMSRFVAEITACTESLLICIGLSEDHQPLPDCSVIAVETDVPITHVFNRLQQIYNLFDEWEKSLNRIYESGTFSEMIDCCDPVICDPVSLSDHSFHYIGYSKTLSLERGIVKTGVDENNCVPHQQVSNMIIDKKFNRLNHMRELYITPPFGDLAGDFMGKNLFFENKYVGKLGIKLSSNEESQVNYNRTIMEFLYEYVEKMYKKYMSFNQNNIQLSGLRTLLKDSFEKDCVIGAQWEYVCQENGWGTTDRLALVILMPNFRYDKEVYAKYFCGEIEQKWQGSACIEYRDKLVMLINIDRYRDAGGSDFFQELAYFLRENLMVAGLSRSFREIGLLSAAYSQANIAVEFGTKASPSLWYYRFNDYALAYMLSLCASTMGTERICSEKLLTLLEYDEAKHTEYFRTLEIYFECRFNASAASEKLCIQRSSFLKRLQRIREMTGVDLDSNEELLYCSISFQMLHRSGAV